MHGQQNIKTLQVLPKQRNSVFTVQ